MTASRDYHNAHAALADHATLDRMAHEAVHRGKLARREGSKARADEWFSIARVYEREMRSRVKMFTNDIEGGTD